MRQPSISETRPARQARVFFIMICALALSALACGNVPERPDSQATVQAFYATITQQAASGSPFPTRDVTQQATQAVNPTTAATNRPTLTPSVTPTPPNERSSDNGALTTIPRCPSNVNIQVNGAGDDWQNWPDGASPARIVIDTPTFGEDEWLDKGDLSGEAFLCWNSTALYVLINVTDDVLVQNQQGRTSWRGDEIEFFFDSELTEDYYEGSYNADDTHLGINPGNFSDNPANAIRYRPNEAVLSSNQLLFASSRSPQSGANYAVEMAVPWSLLRFVPQAETNYGMCIAISDNDHVDTAQQDSMVSHCRQLRTPVVTTFATIRLED